MPQYIEWDPAFRSGHEILDIQHETLLRQCNRLADLCSSQKGGTDEAAFDDAMSRLRAMAREHFVAEASLLGEERDGHRGDHCPEAEEFEYLMGEVATASNFDRRELQRFLAVWWLGHIRGMAG